MQLIVVWVACYTTLTSLELGTFAFATVQTFNSCISRPHVCQCLVVYTPLDNMSKNKPSTSMLMMTFMYPCPGNWMAIGPAVVYYARTAQTFSAGIKCQHCRSKTAMQSYHCHKLFPMPDTNWRGWSRIYIYHMMCS